MTETTDTRIAVSIDTFVQIQRDRQLLRELFWTLQQSAPDYLPDTFRLDFVDESYNYHEGEEKPLTADPIAELYPSLQSSSPGFAYFTKGDPPVVSLSFYIHVGPGRARFHGDRAPLRHEALSLIIDRDLANSASKRQRLLDVVKLLFRTCGGFFGRLGTGRLMKKELIGWGNARRLVVGNIEDGLPPPEWGFLLGPDYVKLLGAERLRLAPCEVVHEFGDRSYMLLIAENFESLEKDQRLLDERRQRLVEHLGSEFFSYVKEARPKTVLPQFSSRTT